MICLRLDQLLTLAIDAHRAHRARAQARDGVPRHKSSGAHRDSREIGIRVGTNAKSDRYPALSSILLTSSGTHFVVAIRKDRDVRVLEQQIGVGRGKTHLCAIK